MSVLFKREDLFGGGGHMKTQALFKEVCRPTDTPILSLRPAKPGGLPSLRDLYLEYATDDPSEVVFAETVFGDLSFWLNITKRTWMKEYLKDWRNLAETRRKSKAFVYITSEVKNQGRSAFSAAKYLIDEPWKDKRTAATKREADKTSLDAYEGISDDLIRLKEQGMLQ